MRRYGCERGVRGARGERGERCTRRPIGDEWRRIRTRDVKL